MAMHKRPQEMNMTEYVLCFVKKFDSVLLIEKLKPDWQRGLYNLPGGKIEPGETAKEAAIRELNEETGLIANSTLDLGDISGDGWRVHVIRCIVPSTVIESKTDEHVFWCPFREAIRSPRLINNLKLVIPLADHGVFGWVLREVESGISRDYQLSLPCVSPLI